MKSYKNQQLLEDIYYSNCTKYLLLIASVNNFVSLFVPKNKKIIFLVKLFCIETVYVGD